MATRRIRTASKTTRGYTLGECVGKGTFGSVYLAKKDGQAVAVKVIRLKNLEGKDVAHCEGEARAMAECRHSNIVTLITSFQQENSLYIVMEYCERGSLRDYLKALTNNLEEAEILNYLTQICRAIQFIHGKGKCHRDVKTANVLITKDWVLKLGDMALTRDIRPNFEMTRLPGTPIYMSPEVIEGKSYDQKADIWSLGCCFYELCTREGLFALATEFDNLKAMIKMCRNLTLRIPLCKEMDSVFKAMMSHDPQNRPSADEILSRLESHSHNTTRTRTPENPKPSSSPRNASARTGSRSTRSAPVELAHHVASPRTGPRLNNSYSRHLRDSTGDLNETSDYGTDNEHLHDDVSLVSVSVKVQMAEEQRHWYRKQTQLLEDIQKRVNDATMQEIRRELTKSYDDTAQFLDHVKKLMPADTYRKCEPDLEALVPYTRRLMALSFKLAT